MAFKDNVVPAEFMDERLWSQEDMFGFIARRNVPEAQPEAHVGRDRTPVTLVTREDIYREQVLLVKKGYEVEMDDLPKLIKNGAKPSQFTLKMDPEEAQHVLGHGNPIVKLARSEKRVLVLDPDQKSLKRTIDCFFVCGFSLPRIHPVRLASHLDWALRKYQPQVLVADYELLDGRDGLSLLSGLTLADNVEHVILTLPARTFSSEEESLILELSQRKNIQVLKKPVSRFALHRLLASPPR